MLARKLIEAAAVPTGEAAEAIDFDGTNDYLSRTSDLTGNADGSTFTLSFWVWSDVSGLSYIYTTDNTTDARVQTWISTTQVGLYMKNSAGTVILNASATVPNNNPPKNTWINVLWSINLASTSNRSCYINDVLQSSVSWDTYTNGSIDFTQPNHNIAGGPALGGYTKARLSNVYLDKTYRDMSVEANRRLFVTADLKPAAGQATLNPILYLPMDDPTQPGLNAGTGGNFTLTGTIARSGRGPNQYNAPYSDLDGSADFLERTTKLTGIVDGNKFTISWCGQFDADAGNQVFTISTSSVARFYVLMGDGSGRVQVVGYNASGTNILNGYSATGALISGRNYVITISVDLSNAANRHCYVNGVALAMTWSPYTNQDIEFDPVTSPRTRVGVSASSANYFNGKLGALWFNTSYIDLSQPANLAKFVTGTGIDAKPVDLGANGELPTGTSPKIYLPMYGNNAGKNYGTGGNFTVNSGPYTGAKGPNEYWGNKWDFDGLTSYAYRTSALSGVSDGKTFSVSFWFNPDVSVTNDYILSVGAVSNPGGAARLTIYRSSANRLVISAKTASNTYALEVTSASTGFTAGTSNYVQMSFDLTNASNRSIYINGASDAATWTTYTNADIDFTADYWYFGNESNVTSNWFDGKLSEFYFTTEYIDFSQEANRLKFRDAFGNCTDLPAKIAAGDVPNPAIFMRFDPSNPGRNSGTGGDFTAVAYVDGGQL